MGEIAALTPDTGFEAIVTVHHAEIYRYLRRLTYRMGEAEDLSQETFFRAYRAWSALPGDANVRARGERRRLIAHATVQASRHEADPSGPEAAAVAGELQALTVATIQRLPVKQRMAFTLRKLHDLDYELIGQSLDCSAETARAHVFQALRKIRTSLDGHALPRTESTR